MSRLRLQFPNGAKVDRRFASSDPVRRVADFVDVYVADGDLDMASYTLATHYPREEFAGERLDLTLAEANLAGKVVYVHDNDA